LEELRDFLGGSTADGVVGDEVPDRVGRLVLGLVPILVRQVVAGFGSVAAADLPTGVEVPVEFLPERPGEYEFACQMGMLRGKVIVE